MQCKPFPVIDLVATGQNILRLREERGMSVRDLQAYFGFEEPQAIYKWQRGKCLPSVDNLYALGCLLEVPMEDILVRAAPNFNYIHSEEQASACSSHIIISICGTGLGNRTRRHVRRVRFFPEQKRRKNDSFGQDCARKIARFSAVRRFLPAR